MYEKYCNYTQDINHLITDETFKTFYKMYIIFNARKLGWSATLTEGQIVLTKKINKQNNIDRDTRTLMKLLTHV